MRINSSDMQCRWLHVSVWSVNFNTLSCQNYFFSKGYGGNSGGMGALFLHSKMEIPWRKGDLHEIPSMVGVLIFSGTANFK